MGCIRTSGVINIKNCNQTSIKKTFNDQKKENINNDNLANNYSIEEIFEKNASEILNENLLYLNILFYCLYELLNYMLFRKSLKKI